MAGPRRIAITGANGFIGRALASHLAGRGHETVLLSQRDGVRYSDIKSTSLKLTGTQTVVHLAGRAHQRGQASDFEVNQAITASLCHAALQAKVGHLVFVSSIGVNGSVTDGTPFSEADIPHPREPYAMSKLRCEQIVTDSGLAYTLLRPPMVYGPNAPGNFSRLLGLVRAGWPLPLKGVANQRSFLGLDNLLDVITLCIDHPAAVGELFLAADAETLSTRELVEAMALGLDQRVRLFTPPRSVLSAACTLGARRLVDSLYGNLVVDTGKLAKILGWRAKVSAQKGIEHAARMSRP